MCFWVALELRRQAFQEQIGSSSLYTHALNGTDEIYLGALDHTVSFQDVHKPIQSTVSHSQGELGSYPPLLQSE